MIKRKKDIVKKLKKNIPENRLAIPEFPEVGEVPQYVAVENPVEEQPEGPAVRNYYEVPVEIFERVRSPPVVIECEAISDEEIVVFEDLVDGLLPPGFV